MHVSERQELGTAHAEEVGHEIHIGEGDRALTREEVRRPRVSMAERVRESPLRHP